MPSTYVEGMNVEEKSTLDPKSYGEEAKAGCERKTAPTRCQREDCNGSSKSGEVGERNEDGVKLAGGPEF